MSTPEILIVFSALMALIALVTIGIDWIGKPLKHRRFIPRMYRFEDEKLPVDEYGNTRFEAIDAPESEYPQVYAGPWLYQQPMPNQELDPAAFTAPDTRASSVNAHDRANPTVVVPSQPAPRAVAKLDPDLAASATASRSAFTDSLTNDETDLPSRSMSEVDHELLTGPSGDGAGLFGRSTIAGTSTSSMHATGPETAWSPGMALDTTVNDQKPSLATKAERFWMATAEASANSHFGTSELERMANGKAPRRTNPRTGKTEAMQLTGLRQASERNDVRMRWPDHAVDPWSAS